MAKVTYDKQFTALLVPSPQQRQHWLSANVYLIHQ
jgi:hypothetical protein